MYLFALVPAANYHRSRDEVSKGKHKPEKKTGVRKWEII